MLSHCCTQGLSRILGIASQVWQLLPLLMGLSTWIRSCCAGGEHFNCGLPYPAAARLGQEAVPRRLLESSCQLPALMQCPLLFAEHGSSCTFAMVGLDDSADTPKLGCCRLEVCCCCRLAERQTASGGLNGRPEKLQDVSGCQCCRAHTQMLHSACAHCLVPL